MANRFWVGGSGAWDASNTANWSATSGGPAGASVPTAADNVTFDASSGGGTVTVEIGGVSCLAFTAQGFTGTIAGPGTITIADDFTMGSTVTWTHTGILKFVATSGTHTIHTGGQTVGAITIDGAGATFTLSANTTCTNAVTLTNGTLSVGVRILTCSQFVSSNTNVRTLSFSSGQLVLTRADGSTLFLASNSTNFTLTKGTSKIRATGAATAGTNTFSFGGLEIYDLQIEAGSNTLAITNCICNNLIFTGFSGTWSNGAITVRGNLTLSTGMTVTGGTGLLTLAGAAAVTQTITSNGKTFDRPVTIDATGATITLADALTMGATRALTITNGAFNANGKAVKAGSIAGSNSNTRSALFAGCAVEVLDAGTAWNFATTTGLTFTAPASLKFTDTSNTDLTFAGGGKTYGQVWFSRGASTGANIIGGANTLAITDDGTGAHSLKLPAGVTQTLNGDFDVNGASPTARISLRSTSDGVAALLAKTSGRIECKHLDIKDSTVSGGAEFRARRSPNTGNNTGWKFLHTGLLAVQ